MGIFGSRFRLSSNGYFMELRGPAGHGGSHAARRSSASSPPTGRSLADCSGSWPSGPTATMSNTRSHRGDGMYLGRCFLTDEHEVGLLWAAVPRQPPHVLLRSG